MFTFLNIVSFSFQKLFTIFNDVLKKTIHMQPVQSRVSSQRKPWHRERNHCMWNAVIRGFCCSNSNGHPNRKIRPSVRENASCREVQISSRSRIKWTFQKKIAKPFHYGNHKNKQRILDTIFSKDRISPGKII